MPYVSRYLQWFTHPLVLVVYLAVVAGVFFYVDEPLALYIHHLNLASIYSPLLWITQLGWTTPYLLLLPLLGLFFRYIKRAKQIELRVWFLWSTLFITSGVAVVLKNILGRARPELLFDLNVFGLYGYHREHLYHSFPSGHTTLVTTMILGLILLFPKQRWWFFVVGTVVLMTRVLLTQHYLSDVLASICLVMLEYRLFMYIVARECPLYWVRLGLKDE
ncbi:MAG: phosphatase PAP2 family protein [Gammaproteobacteria bacterium]|nr:phosphatase PAP2 family protein [Gammaproteobacteria bacterium]